MNKDKWSALSMKDRANFIKMGVESGITDLGVIRERVNSLGSGGDTRLGTPYASTYSSNYDYFNASPKNVPTSSGGHWTSRNPITGQILKSEKHPTFKMAMDIESILGNDVYKSEIDGNYYTYAEGELVPFGMVKQTRETQLPIPLDPVRRFEGIKTTNNRPYIPENISLISDRLDRTSLGKHQKNAILSSIIEESGGRPLVTRPDGKHQGLLQWENSRYEINPDNSESEEMDSQLAYMMETLYNTSDKQSWTDGGKGSGYKTAKQAQKTFMSTKDPYKAVHSLNRSYVRPPEGNAPVVNRYKVAKQIERNSFGSGGQTTTENNNSSNSSENKSFWSRIGDAITQAAYDSRDAKVGAIGANQVRDLYSKGSMQEAADAAKGYIDGNGATEIALGFTPFIGTAIDIGNAIKDPSLLNIGFAGLSLGADLIPGGAFVKGGIKGTLKGINEALSTIKKGGKGFNNFNFTPRKTLKNKSRKAHELLYKTRGDISKADWHILDAEHPFGYNGILIGNTTPDMFKVPKSPNGVSQDIPFKLPDGSEIIMKSKLNSQEKTIENLLIYENVDGSRRIQNTWGDLEWRMYSKGMQDIPLHTNVNPKFVKYIDDISTNIGNLGSVAGSSLLYKRGYISGVPHDLELITTEGNLHKLQESIGFTATNKTPFAIQGKSKIAGALGDTDIQIIESEPLDGKAVGKLAHEIYRTMYPEQWAKYLSYETLDRGSKHAINSYNLELPKPGAKRTAEGYYKSEDLFTPEELLEEFNKSGASVKKTLIDALIVGKTGGSYQGTKLYRPLGLLYNTDPSMQDEILDAIHTIGKFNLGSDYKSAKQFYKNLDFSDVEANKKFLKELGLDEDLASNPKAMDNITEYYHLQLSSSGRNVNANTPEELVKFVNSTNAPFGGTFSGAGGNSTVLGSSFSDVQFTSMSQFPIAKNTETVKTPLDIMNAYKRAFVNTEEFPKDVINSLKNLGITLDNYNLEELHYHLGHLNNPELAKEVGNILNVNGVFTKDYGGRYFGRYSDLPSSSSYRTRVNSLGHSDFSVDYELGRLLHTYKDNATYRDELISENFKQVLKRTINEALDGKVKTADGIVDINEKAIKEVRRLQDRYKKATAARETLVNREKDLEGYIKELSDIASALDKVITFGVGTGLYLDLKGLKEVGKNNKEDDRQ